MGPIGSGRRFRALNDGNAAMGRRKLFTREDVLNKTIPVFWKHGLAERVFRTSSRPREFANPACMQSSRTKRTYLSQACGNLWKMLTAHGSPDGAAFRIGTTSRAF